MPALPRLRPARALIARVFLNKETKNIVAGHGAAHL